LIEREPTLYIDVAAEATLPTQRMTVVSKRPKSDLLQDAIAPSVQVV
jgi:hypothetical protein